MTTANWLRLWKRKKRSEAHQGRAYDRRNWKSKLKAAQVRRLGEVIRQVKRSRAVNDGVFLSRADRGTYALVLRLDSHTNLLIGKLGRFDFRAGFYVYVGSAMGQGGIGGRLKHHVVPTPRAHWHIDYLRQVSRLEEVWALESPVRREHDWAALFLTMPGATIAIPGFGASDCRCAGHLIYFTDRPAVDDFCIRVARQFPDDSRIRQYQFAEIGR